MIRETLMNTTGEDNPSTKPPRTVTSDLKAVGRWVDRHARYFLAASVIGFVLTAVLHISSFFIAPSSVVRAASNLLFVGVFPVWFGLVLLLSRRKKEKDYGFRESLARFVKDRRSKRSSSLGVYRHLPRRGSLLIQALWIYVAINACASIYLLGHERAEVVKGRLVLVNKGKVVREVPRDVWNAKLALQYRTMSGFPISFYAYCMIFFYYRPDEKHYQEYLQWRKKQRTMGEAGQSAPKVPGV